MQKLINHPELQEFIQEYPCGDSLFSEGDPASCFFILVSGQVDIIKGQKKISEINTPGAIFGEMSLVLHSRRTATIIAASKLVRVLSIPNHELAKITRRFPDFTEKLTINLAQRLHETTNLAHGLKEFCDQLPDAVVMAAPSQKIISWNKAAEHLFGRNWQQMRSSTLADIFDDQPTFHHLMTDLKQNESIREITLKINHPAESWKFVSTSTRVLRDPHANILTYLFITRDITRHHNLQAKHTQVKKRFLSGMIILTVLVGIACWNLAGISRQAPPPNPAIQNFARRISGDFLALNLLINLADKQSMGSPASLIRRYFSRQTPGQNGITGLIILDRQRNISAFYSKKEQNTATELVGSHYDGARFVADTGIKLGQPTIFMVTRPGQNGGKAVELAFELHKDQHISGWLIFQLDLDWLEKTYQMDISHLAKLEFPNL